MVFEHLNLYDFTLSYGCSFLRAFLVVHIYSPFLFYTLPLFLRILLSLAQMAHCGPRTLVLCNRVLPWPLLFFQFLYEGTSHAGSHESLLV